MKRINIIENLFISITFAEERIFKNIAWDGLLQKWNLIWVTIAFAEEGIIYPSNVQLNFSEMKTGQCEFGDISCFLTRNA